jgi:hypothetical protein
MAHLPDTCVGGVNLDDQITPTSSDVVSWSIVDAPHENIIDGVLANRDDTFRRVDACLAGTFVRSRQRTRKRHGKLILKHIRRQWSSHSKAPYS